MANKYLQSVSDHQAKQAEADEFYVSQHQDAISLQQTQQLTTQQRRQKLAVGQHLHFTGCYC